MVECITNSTQETRPLCLHHPAENGNLTAIFQSKVNSSISNNNPRHTIRCAIDLVIKLKICAAELWMLLICLTPK